MNETDKRYLISDSYPLRSRPLKVALVAPPYFQVPPLAYGGIEAVLADLANALVDLGHQVTLIGAGRPGTRARFHSVWPEPVSDRLGEPGPEVMYAVASRRVIVELAAAGQIDLVHDHTFAGPLNAPYYTTLGLPTVVTVHGPVDGELRDYYQLLGQDVSLIAISDRQRSMAPELNWVSRVYNGLQLSEWPFQADKDNYALFLGRFSADKGAHLALDAAHAAGMPVVLAGKCSEPAERAYFAREVEPRLGPGDVYIGIADAAKKRELLTRAACLLFPVQWEEPFGMVMIEAMACGTPVVALRAGAVPEVIAPNVTGLICDDIAELPAALRDVVTLDSATCRRHVAERFSAGRMASGYASAYREILSRSRSTTTASTTMTPVLAGGRHDRIRRPSGGTPPSTVTTPGRGR